MEYYKVTNTDHPWHNDIVEIENIHISYDENKKLNYDYVEVRCWTNYCTEKVQLSDLAFFKEEFPGTTYQTSAIVDYYNKGMLPAYIYTEYKSCDKCVSTIYTDFNGKTYNTYKHIE